jgi:hypothetical protein
MRQFNTIWTRVKMFIWFSLLGLQGFLRNGVYPPLKGWRGVGLAPG